MINRFLAAACLAALASACKPTADEALGPPSSFALFAPAHEQAAGPNTVTLTRIKGKEAAGAQVSAALIDGFAAEMLRTVFSAQQYIANLKKPSAPAPKAVAWATDAVPFVIGLDQAAGPQTGAALAGSWIGGPVLRPQTIWIGLPGDFADTNAVAPLVAVRIAKYVGLAAASDGQFTVKEHVLATAYEQAIGVVAREWRSPTSARVLTPKLGQAEAQLFAGIRENRFVLDANKQVRPARQLLEDPRVAATVFYRWFQDKALMKKVASDAFYAPLKNDRVPVGISMAAVLGSFRNLQMKVLGTWIGAVRAHAPPANIADLVAAYGRQFPEERASVLRLFLATTYGATAKPGGVSPKPQDAEAALAELSDLFNDVISGKTPLLSAP